MYRCDYLISFRELFNLWPGMQVNAVTYAVNHIEEELKPYGGLKTLRVRVYDEFQAVKFSGVSEEDYFE